MGPAPAGLFEEEQSAPFAGAFLFGMRKKKTMKKIICALAMGVGLSLLQGCPPPETPTTTGTDKPATGTETPTTDATSTETPAAPAGATKPDLSHVKVGQKYHYTMTNAGAAPMTMIYEVKEVGDNLVKYTTQMIMDMGQGPAPVGEPNPMEWKHVEAPATTPTTTAEGPKADISREKVKVGSQEFDCMVITSGNTKTWVPATGDIPTFPGLIKTQTDGNTTMELTKIE